MIHETITDGLNQCPFCGGAAEMKIYDHIIKSGEYSVNVRCTVCGCGTPDFHTGQTFQFEQGEPSSYRDLTEVKSKAIKAYNRVPQKSHDEKMLLQGYRKITKEHQGEVQNYVEFFIRKQRQEKQERRNGFTVVAGAAERG